MNTLISSRPGSLSTAVLLVLAVVAPDPVRAQGADGRTGAAATPVAAGDAARARATALFKEANALAKRKMFLDALARYREARALYPSYKIDVNTAGTLEAMGRHAEAAEAFERFLVASADAPPPVVAAAHARLASLRSRLASVRVECLVEGALVTLDGRDVGRTPMTMARYVEPGRRELKVSRAGFLLAGETLTLGPGQHVVQNVRLRSVAEAQEYVAYQKRVDVYQSKTLRGTIALGVGAGLLAAGAVLYGVGFSSGNRAADRMEEAVWPEDLVRYEEDVDYARGVVIGGHVVMGLAAAAGGYALYELLTRPSTERPTEEPGVFPLISLGGAPGGAAAAVGLRGRF